MTIGAKSILIVEDNADDETLILRALKKNNIKNEVIVAHDGVEALDYFFGSGQYANRDVYDLPQLVLLDLKLPKADGFTVLKKIRESEVTRFVPVIVLTSSREDYDLTQCYSLGVNSYIRKPVDFNAFTEAVKQLGLYWLLLNETPPTQR